MKRVLYGRPVIAGEAEGIALVSREPLSFWGGLSSESGEIIDRRHELSGETVTGRVFVFPRGRGSSTGSAVLLQSIKSGTAPAAIINLKTDPILALGAIVADELYRRSIPIVVLAENDFHAIKPGDHLAVDKKGVILLFREKVE